MVRRELAAAMLSFSLVGAPVAAQEAEPAQDAAKAEKEDLPNQQDDRLAHAALTHLPHRSAMARSQYAHAQGRRRDGRRRLRREGMHPRSKRRVPGGRVSPRAANPGL